MTGSKGPLFILAKIHSWVPAEIVRGHLYHSPIAESALAEKRCLHLFIYRDPRDVVCSEAHYLSRMNRWHRLHRTFRDLEGDDERIQFSIEGDRGGIAPIPYDNIGARFERYIGWLQAPDTLSIRFEDLIGEKQRETVSAILKFMEERGLEIGPAETDLCLQKIQPESSHTFRKGGGVRNWERRFNAKHRALFKEHAGPLLIQLGYEADSNW
jgi:hypothetical protein